MPPKAEAESPFSGASPAGADAPFSGGSSSSSLPRALLFDGRSAAWPLWQKNFFMYLAGRGLDDILDAAVVPPLASDAPAHKAWSQRAAQVGSLLLCAFSPGVQALVTHVPSNAYFARAAMKIVTDSYQRSTVTSKARVMRELHDATMQPGETIETWSSRLSALVMQLRTMGEPVSPGTHVFVLLNGLPTAYEVTVKIIRGREKQEYADVMTLLLDAQEDMARGRRDDTHHAASLAGEDVPYHQQQQQQQHHRAPQNNQSQQQQRGGNSGGAAYASYRGGGSRGGRNGPSRGGGGGRGQQGPVRKCYGCGETDHVAYDCVTNRNAVKCRTCRMLGHTDAQCQRPSRGDARSQQQQAQMAYEMETRARHGEQRSSYSGQYHSGDDDDGAAWSAVVEADAALSGLDGLTDPSRSSWIMDTGATMSLTNNLALLHGVQRLPAPLSIRVANNEVLLVECAGSCALTLPNGKRVTLQRVGYHPKLSANLLSVAAVTRAGFDVVFGDAEARIVTRRTNKVWARVPKQGNMFVIHQAQGVSARGPAAHLANQAGLAPQPQHNAADVPSAAPTSHAVVAVPGALSGDELAHARYGHIGGLRELIASRAVIGLPALTATRGSTRDESESVCGGCAAGKSHRAPLSHATHDASRPSAAHHLGSRMSADLCGPVVLAPHEDHSPVSVSALRSMNYVSLLIDEYSRRVWVMLLQRKSDAAAALMTLLSQIEKMRAPDGQLVRVGELHTDGGGEYRGAELQAFFRQRGIRHTVTIPYTPQHNGIVERMNGTLLGMARAMLHHARLPTVFWGQAIMFAAYLRNRCTTEATARREDDGRPRTPMELWTGEKPDVTRVRVFGSDARVNITAQLRGGKFDETSHPCIMLGMHPERRGYRLFDLVEERMVVQRSVVCAENVFTHRGPRLMAALGLLDDRAGGLALVPDAVNQPANLDYRNALELAKALSLSEEVERQRQAAAAPQEAAAPPAAAAAPPAASDDEEVSDESSPSPPEAAAAPEPASARAPAAYVERRAASDRVRNPPPVHNVSAFLAEMLTAPGSYAEAMRRPDAPQWTAAMRAEMEAHRVNGTWVLVSMPEGHHAPMGNKWVFAVKLRPDGAVERYKARVVAKGFSQVYGLDYTETFAPTLRYKALRVLFSLATGLDYELDQMDVTTAFLNATMKEEVYMRQPEGFEEPRAPEGRGPPRVCRLMKTLYGTKQASREWYLEVSKFITGPMGYTACASDPCVYWRRSAGGRPMWIGLFVDDLVIVYSPLDRAEWVECKRLFMARYTSKDMGAAQLVVGMRVTRSRSARMTRVDQEVHIREMLKRFDMAECRAEPTPEASGVQLSDEDCPPADDSVTRAEAREHAELREQYQSIVGSLLYISLACRPDIAHAVGQLGRFVAQPGAPHMVAAKRVLRYLRGTMALGLVYSGAGLEHVGSAHPLQVPVLAYTDADWAGCIMTRRSTTGYLVYVFGCLVSWSATRQKTVALSSAESEYMALGETVMEVKWMHALLGDMQCRAPIVEDDDEASDVSSTVASPTGTGSVASPTLVYIDSQSAMAMADGGGAHGRTKHIDARHHFVRDYQRAGRVRLHWVSTADQLADLLTKALPAVTFIRLRDMIVSKA